MVGQKNFLDMFYDWAIRTGKKPAGTDKPSEPLAPIGVKAKLRLLRRILVDLGYMKAVKISGNGHEYKVWPFKGCKRIYNIKPQEIIRWVDKEFPTLKNRQDRQRKAAYVTAAWKFGEYLHWEMKDRHSNPLWKWEQLRELKGGTHTPRVKDFEVEILPIEKIDSLIDFIEDRNITHYTMIYLSRWLGGMRYQEVINVPLDLDGPALQINFKTGQVTIWGKGDGGMQKPRYPTLSPQVKEVLKKYLEYRKTITPASEEDGKYLFLTLYRKKWGENSGSFNIALRGHAQAQGKLTKKEIKLVTSHNIGRHGFGTYHYPNMKDKPLMRQMGLENEKMLRRYANLTREEEDKMFLQATTKNNDHEQPKPKRDKATALMELLGISREKATLVMELVS